MVAFRALGFVHRWAVVHRVKIRGWPGAGVSVECGRMTPRGPWAARPDLIEQHSTRGVIKVATLKRLGMNSKTIYRRCLPGQPWQRLLPGIVLLHNGKPTQDERVIAAMQYAGEGALLTGTEACIRHGLRRGEFPSGTDLHVLVPHEHKIKSCEFLTVERTIRMPRPTVRDGFPLAPLVRATTDIVRRIRRTEPVERILIESMQRGRCSPEALARELDTGTQRGTAIPRRALRELTETKSMAEVRAKDLVRVLDVKPSHWNVPVHSTAGKYVGCPDAWWDDVGLAWEIDSFEFHLSRAGYARTIQRNTRYAAVGVAVVQTLPSRLERDPASVLTELNDAYQAAAARPRPAVHLVPRAA